MLKRLKKKSDQGGIESILLSSTLETWKMARRNQTKVGLKAAHIYDLMVAEDEKKKSDQGGIERCKRLHQLQRPTPGRNQTKVGLKEILCCTLFPHWYLS